VTRVNVSATKRRLLAPLFLGSTRNGIREMRLRGGRNFRSGNMNEPKRGTTSFCTTDFGQENGRLDLGFTGLHVRLNEI